MTKKIPDVNHFFLDLPLGAEFLVKIKTSSMYPLFLIGDTVLVKKIEFDQVKIGDIICFFHDLNSSLIIHRTIAKQLLSNKKRHVFITKGDALQVSDYQKVSKNLFIGLVLSKVKENEKIAFFDKQLFITSQRLLFRFKLFRDFFY